MQEFITDAVVLNKGPSMDFDARYSFFTRRFGKIVGKAKSVRKITSKLAGHLEPGNLVRIRFVERNGGGGTQVVDALKDRTLEIALPNLRLLDMMLHEGEPDAALWNELLGAPGKAISWPRILRILGWDPAGAACDVCGKAATHFYIPRQEFFCAVCASKLEQDGLLLVVYAEV